MVDTKKISLGGQSTGCTVVLGMGGTIAGRASQEGDTVGYIAGQVPVSDLLKGLPAAQSLRVEAEQVAQIDSKDMTHQHWLVLSQRVLHHLAREDVQSIVITHGTDTAEETAFFLQTVLRPSKPVVLACAMRPVTALVPDGPQNLNDALCVAQHPGAQGVVLVCAGWVHSALDVAKVHTTDLDAFDSGDAGALGRVMLNHVTLFRPWPVSGGLPRAQAAMQKLQTSHTWPRVEWLVSHTDNDGAMLRALLAQRAQGAYTLDGLVVAGTGNGSLHAGLEGALSEAQAQGVRVRVSSRCAYGQVIAAKGMGRPETSGWSPVKARVALTLDLLGLSD